MDYEAIICFETHVELSTNSKLFCGCPVAAQAEPNSNICEVCTGQPGALPVLNRRAMELAIKAGLALGCEINRRARFARKNYFYPDLPKGYQISQYELPFCVNGVLEITGDDGGVKPVGIKRIHLEEDAGKLMHATEGGSAQHYSMVDYNRACVPLLEIVTDHERHPLSSVQEARTYLDKLRQILRYIGVSECLLEQGQFRCDVNVSLRRTGEQEFGNRAEVKNMSSFRFMMEAIEYEIERQGKRLDAGEPVVQETLLFDEVAKVTRPMRSKEDAPDYRYFPDPDLIELVVDEALVTSIAETLPEMPDQQLQRLIETFGLERADAVVLTREKAVSEYFRACAEACTDATAIGKWMTRDMFALLKSSGQTIEQCLVSPQQLAELVNLVLDGTITEGIGRRVLEQMFASGERACTIIEAEGLKTIDDDEMLSSMVKQAIDEHPQPVAQLRAGDTKPLNFLMGQVMRKSLGKADPAKVREKIIEQVK